MMKYTIPEWYRGGQNPWYVPGKFLEVGVGNNAFSLPKKADRNLLAITPLRAGSLDELRVGKQVGFQDFDGDQWLECVGLESAILCLDYPVPIYIFDNHNHVFYAWAEALKMGWFQSGATLVHMDEHFDDSEPSNPLAPLKGGIGSLEDVWRYTNEVLQIATYIKPALHLGIFKECLSYVESADFKMRNEGSSDIVLNLDIDVFHADMSHISWQQKIDVIKYYLPRTKLVTIATSPYFIDQEKAIEFVKKIILLQEE
jgi:hypothetical protein